jgi:hypothetical protein
MYMCMSNVDKCVYVHVCICLYIHVCIHTHTHTHTHTRDITVNLLSKHTRGRSQTAPHTHTHAHTHTHTHTHRIKGKREIQLACYLGRGDGYKRHTDAMPEIDMVCKKKKSQMTWDTDFSIYFFVFSFAMLLNSSPSSSLVIASSSVASSSSSRACSLTRMCSLIRREHNAKSQR